MPSNQRILLTTMSSLLLGGCVWVFPTEPRRRVPADAALPHFEEAPVDFAHHWDRAKGHHLTGAAVLDVDGDGREEIFVGGGEDQPDALLSLRDGRLVDRIGPTGLSSLTATYGSLAIDLDGDGDIDLLVCRNDGVTLYVNDGSGIFRGEKLPIAFAPDSVPLAIAASDIDHDGDADLYVSVFVDFPHFVAATFNVPTHAKPNHLLRNDGNLHFTDVTDSVTASKQNTFTSIFVDLDGDGLQDLVVAQNTGEVEILRNLGGGHFERAPFSSGYGFWMGVAAGDFDGDGDPDLVFTNVGDSFPAFIVRGDRRDDQAPANGWLLLRNDGGFRFTDVTGEAGLAGLGFAWGPVFEDVNLDGNLDLLVSQNYVKWPIYRIFKFPGKVLLGTGAPGGFYPAPVAENRAYSNSPVIADLDGDSRPDLFWLNNDGPSRAFLNRTAANVVGVALPDDVRSLGARVRAEGAASGYVREVASSSGLGVDQSPLLVFGLGPEGTAARVIVSWPDGRTSVVEDPPVNRTVRVEPPAPLRPVTRAGAGARGASALVDPAKGGGDIAAGVPQFERMPASSR